MIDRHVKVIVAMAGVFLLVACSTSSKAIPDAATACSEPRSKVCTREYVPVCGVKANSLAKTYGNACSACADEQVNYVLKGACTGKKPNV